MPRSSIFVILVLLLLSHGVALAGSITGDIYKDGSKVPGAAVTVKSGDKVVATSKTNEKGKYFVYVSKAGYFKLCVNTDGATPCMPITSTASPQTVDVELHKSGSEWRLRRKQ